MTSTSGLLETAAEANDGKQSRHKRCKQCRATSIGAVADSDERFIFMSPSILLLRLLLDHRLLAALNRHDAVAHALDRICADVNRVINRRRPTRARRELGHAAAFALDAAVVRH